MHHASRLASPLSLTVLALASSCGPRAPVAPSVTALVVTQSDAWVTENLRVQQAYTRVLVVSPAGAAPASLLVRPLALNDRNPRGAAVALPVHAAFTTIQAAVDAAEGGDLVAVLPGKYAGFVVDERPKTAQGRYLHIKAMGDVAIDAPAHADGDRWMILIRAAHHVIVEGFDVAGPLGAASLDPPRATPWAGIMLDGDFARSGRLVHHVAIVDNVVHHHRLWGLHSTDTRQVLLQGNTFAFSAREHGAYVSDGSDEYVIRRNVFFANHDAGLQVNLDPVASFEELLRHPHFAAYPKGTTAAWARQTLAAADRAFGPDNYPDGRGHDFVIEDNVFNENGRGGGGALNLAALSRSLIQNNLVYGNYAHGIAQWNNDNPYDRELEDPGPAVPADVKGPESLPIFGCQYNVIRNNTVIMAAPGRAALQAVYGSYGSRIANNLLVNDGASLEVSGTGVYDLSMGTNLVGTVRWTGKAESLLAMAKRLPPRGQPIASVTRAALSAEVVRYGEAPWLLFDGRSFRLNPDRPNFHPTKASRLLGRGDADDLPARDLDGAPRRTADIGAYGAD